MHDKSIPNWHEPSAVEDACVIFFLKVGVKHKTVSTLIKLGKLKLASRTFLILGFDSQAQSNW